jgi:glycosyltransferase involved in cell wall biosynthesis
MRVLFVTQYFPPETEIGGIRIWELARRLMHRGHEVMVLTGLPNYPTGALTPAYGRKARGVFFTEFLDGIKVARVILYPSHSKDGSKRLANYVSFAGSASLRALALRGLDIIVATSPPLTAGLPACVAACVNRAPLVMELRDLWPEAAIQLGYLRSPLARRSAYALEHALYKRATAIVSVSNGIREDIVARGVEADKCTVLFNGIDPELFSSQSRNHQVEALKAGGRVVGLYLGSLSEYHGLDLALDLLSRLQPHDRFRILFAGGGSARSALEAAVQDRGLTNAIFLPAPTRPEMPGLAASADFCLAFVKESAFSRWLLSSKVFMYMACARPIFAAAAGETRRVIEEANAGIVAEPSAHGVAALAETLLGMTDGSRFAEYGDNGRRYIERSHTWASVASAYEHVLLDAIATHGSQ